MTVGVRLYRRGGQWWVTIHTGGARFRRPLGTTKQREAEKMAEEILRRLRDGEAITRSRPTVRSYADARMKAWEDRLRETTLVGYRLGLAEGLQVIGHKELQEVTRADAIKVAERVQRGKKGPRAEATIKGRLAAFQVLWSEAIDEGLVTFNPFAKKARLVRRVAVRDHSPTDEREVIPYTRDEQKKLLEVVSDLSDRVAILVALRAGLRRSEVLALRRVDVDIHTRRLSVSRRLARARIEAPKSEAGTRDVPLSLELTAAIRKLIAHQNERALAKGRKVPELLFPAKYQRSAETYAQEENQFGRRFARYLEAAKIPRGTRHPFHRLRHTFASELLADGTPVQRVSRWMGHSDTRITERVYAHWIPRPDEHLDVDRLDGFRHNSATIPPQSHFRPPKKDS